MNSKFQVVTHSFCGVGLGNNCILIILAGILTEVLVNSIDVELRLGPKTRDMPKRSINYKWIGEAEPKYESGVKEK